MKLQIGKADYPHQHGVESAVIRGRKAGRDIPLILVSMDDMESIHKKLPNIRGMPTRVAFDFKRSRVWLHPLPDGEYELDIVDAVPAHKDTAPDQKRPIIGTITKAVAAGFGRK